MTKHPDINIEIKDIKRLKGKKKNREYEKFLGECLKVSRKKRGVTQKELASAVGISQSAYVSYENGNRRCPGTILIKISKALEMPIESIIEQTEGERQKKLYAYKDLENIVENMPLDDLEAFAEAFEIELAQDKEWLKDYKRDTPAIKWAGKGIEIAEKVNKRGQDMIEQFIESVMSNPAMLK